MPSASDASLLGHFSLQDRRQLARGSSSSKAAVALFFFTFELVPDMLLIGTTLAFSGEMSVGTTLTAFLYHLNYWQFSWSDVLPQEMQSCLAIPFVPIICSEGTHFFTPAELS